MKQITGKKSLAAALMVAAALFSFIASVSPNALPEVFQRLENTLLDMRLRMRAERFTPSSDIVVVAFDQGSKEYFEKHPELGVPGNTLPRKKLADVINILHDKGAKSIVLDIEMKAPSENIADDHSLAQAIQASGNVSVASYADYSLQQFLKQDLQGFDRSIYQNATFISAYIQPYLNQAVRQCRLFPNACIQDFIALNAQSAYPLESFTLRLPSNFFSAWESMTAIDYFSGKGYGHGLQMPPKRLASDAGALQEAYTRLCVQDRYQQLYEHRPAFLSNLGKQAGQVKFSIPPDFEDESRHTYCRMSPVIEPVAAAAKQIGVSTVNYEDKAFLRQVPVFYKGYQGNYFYYLPIVPVMQTWGNPEIQVNKTGLEIVGQKHIDTFENHDVLINWRNPKKLAANIYRELGIPLSMVKSEDYADINSRHQNQILGYGHLYRVVSVADLLKRQQNPNNRLTPTLYNLYGRPASGEFDFKNKTIIYGDMVKDIHITPVGDIIYGPEILANVADMITHDRNFVHSAPIPITIFLVLALLGLVTYPVIAWPRFSIGVAIAFIGLTLFCACNFMLFIQEGLFIPLTWPILLALLSLFGTIIFRYSVQDREKRQLTHIFSKYVSPQVMQEILNDTGAALENLKGQKKELTVLFVDIHNFTEQLENTDADKMLVQLNEYFNAMTDVVLAHNGTYDKYMGDALMAFFGAPADNPKHAEDACKAALEMQKTLAGLNQKWEAEGLSALQHGIGLASGPMLVGNIGSEKIKNFTVVGSVVNLGSRLEALTRQLKTDILVNVETQKLASHNNEFQFINMGNIEIKGFSQPVPVYALNNTPPTR